MDIFRGKMVCGKHWGWVVLSQLAKIPEVVKQRAEKLQKEEEDCIREPKVKAMAKLKELNRCTNIADISSQK